MKALAAPQGATAVGQAAGTTDVLADAAGWATPGRAKGSADAQQMVPEDTRSAPNHSPQILPGCSWLWRVGGQSWSPGWRLRGCLGSKRTRTQNTGGS